MTEHGIEMLERAVSDITRAEMRLGEITPEDFDIIGDAEMRSYIDMWANIISYQKKHIIHTIKRKMEK